MLIQNENDKWQYYSVNGNNMFISGSFVGGRPFNDIGVGEWDTPQEFMNSDYNKKTGSNGDNNKAINNYGFTEGYLIKTSNEQDKIMRDIFIKTSKTEYTPLGNNCATIVQQALFDAGIPVAKSKYETIYIPANKHFGEPAYRITRPNFNPIPRSAYKSIIDVNPDGIFIGIDGNR